MDCLQSNVKANESSVDYSVESTAKPTTLDDIKPLKRSKEDVVERARSEDEDQTRPPPIKRLRKESPINEPSPSSSPTPVLTSSPFKDDCLFPDNNHGGSESAEPKQQPMPQAVQPQQHKNLASAMAARIMPPATAAAGQAAFTSVTYNYRQHQQQTISTGTARGHDYYQRNQNYAHNDHYQRNYGSNDRYHRQDNRRQAYRHSRGRSRGRRQYNNY